MNTFKWRVNGSDGKHDVVLQQLGTPRDPMQLFVDGEKTDIVPSPKSLIVNINHSFVCGGEPALLIVFGNKADLVFQGVLQTAKKKYHPNNAIPTWVALLMVLVNIASLTISKGSTWGIVMSVSSALLVYMFTLIPFDSRISKIIKFIALTLVNWGIVFLSNSML